MAKKQSKYEIKAERNRKVDNAKGKRIELEYYNQNRGNIARGTAAHWSTEDLKKVLRKCKNFVIKGDDVIVIDNKKYNEKRTIPIKKALVYFQYWNVNLTERSIVNNQLPYAIDLISKINIDKERTARGMASFFDVKSYEKELKKSQKYLDNIKDPVQPGFKTVLEQSVKKPSLIDIHNGNYEDFEGVDEIKYLQFKNLLKYKREYNIVKDYIKKLNQGSNDSFLIAFYNNYIIICSGLFVIRIFDNNINPNLINSEIWGKKMNKIDSMKSKVAALFSSAAKQPKFKNVNFGKISEMEILSDSLNPLNWDIRISETSDFDPKLLSIYFDSKGIIKDQFITSSVDSDSTRHYFYFSTKDFDFLALSRLFFPDYYGKDATVNLSGKVDAEWDKLKTLYLESRNDITYGIVTEDIKSRKLGEVKTKQLSAIATGNHFAPLLKCYNRLINLEYLNKNFEYEHLPSEQKLMVDLRKEPHRSVSESLGIDIYMFKSLNNWKEYLKIEINEYKPGKYKVVPWEKQLEIEHKMQQQENIIRLPAIFLRVDGVVLPICHETFEFNHDITHQIWISNVCFPKYKDCIAREEEYDELNEKYGVFFEFDFDIPFCLNRGTSLENIIKCYFEGVKKGLLKEVTEKQIIDYLEYDWRDFE